MTLREIVIKYFIEVDKKSQRDAERSVDNFSNKAMAMLKSVAAGVTIKKLIEVADTYNTINNQIDSATESLADFADAQNIVLEASNATRTSYATMAGTIKTLVNSQNALFETTEKAAEYAELMTKAFRNTGMESSTAANYANSLAKSFLTGKVSAGTISTMMTEAPEILEYLADEMGITLQSVKAIGLAGQITARQMYEAITSHSGDIEATYKTLEITVKEATEVAKNKLGTALTRLNNELQFTQIIASTLMSVSDGVAKIIDKITEKVSTLKTDVGSIADSFGILAGFVGVFAKLFSISKGHGLLGAMGALSGASVGSIASIAGAIVLAITTVIKAIQKLKENESFLNRLKEFTSKIGQIIGKILTPLLKIVDAITDLLGKSLASELEHLLFILNNIADALEPLVDIVSFLLDGISQILDFFSFGAMSTANIAEVTKNYKVKTIGELTSAAKSGATINTTITNTFTGTDKEIQQKEAQIMNDSTDKLVRNLRTAVAYGG